MITLSKAQIKHIHKKMLEATGGVDGMRDEGLLDSAIAAPFQTYNGTELFPTAISKIARLAFGIISNHPFVDGNKRIGTYLMLILLELNSINAKFSDDDIVQVGLELADGKMSEKQLLDIIIDRLV
jgi:death-on-curing protein